LPQLYFLPFSQIIYFRPRFQLDRQFVPVWIRQFKQGQSGLLPVGTEQLKQGHGS
jgi:hypothetical protein